MNAHVPFSNQLRQCSRQINEFGFLTGVVTGFLCSTILIGVTIATVFFWLTPMTVFGDEPANTTSLKDLEPRAIGEIRRDVEAFLKNSKSGDDLDLQVGGIVDLCFIHHEIVADPRFDTNRQLQSIRAQAASRLKKYLKNVQLEKIRRERKAKKHLAETNRRLLTGESVEPTKVKTTDDLQRLAEQTQFANSAKSKRETSVDNELYTSMYSSANSLGNLTGGPSQMFGYLSANYAPPWDHGEELIDLIQNTIDPKFWQRNGGAGIIHYYRPSRIIVVGATAKIHDDMTDMLRNLRRLSR